MVTNDYKLHVYTVNLSITYKYIKWVVQNNKHKQLKRTTWHIIKFSLLCRVTYILFFSN